MVWGLLLSTTESPSMLHDDSVPRVTSVVLATYSPLTTACGKVRQGWGGGSNTWFLLFHYSLLVGPNGCVSIAPTVLVLGP